MLIFMAVLVSSFLHVKPTFVLMENCREPLKLQFCASYYKYGKVVAKYTLKRLKLGADAEMSVCVEQHLLQTELLWDTADTSDNELLVCKNTVPCFTRKNTAHIFI